MAGHFAAAAVALGVFAGAAFLGGDNRAGKHLSVIGTICAAVAVMMLLGMPGSVPQGGP